MRSSAAARSLVLGHTVRVHPMAGTTAKEMRGKSRGTFPSMSFREPTEY